LGLLQSWLFFGLLVEAFGGPPMGLMNDEFFYRAEDGVQYITTRSIQKYFWYWQAWRIHVKTEEERAVVEEHAKRLDKVLNLANSVFRRLAKKDDCSRPLDESLRSQHQAILVSIAMIAEWIFEARKIAANVQESYVNSVRSMQWHLPSIEVALYRAGWCGGEIASLLNDCNTTCLYYLSMIDRKITGKNHAECSPKGGCKALNTNYSTYKALHVCDKGEMHGCKPVGPSIRDVAAVLDRGNIPLVVHSGEQSFALQEYNTEKPIVYVAISHVWSDGLGNPSENRLSACTFQHIQHLVNDLYDTTGSPVPFWIDTMCIPPQENHSQEQKNTRKVGIIRMAETYALADKVLVLDNTLQQQSSLIGAIEMNIRIRFGPWATRLWTLQEGRLGRSLYFQFKDRAVSSSFLEDTIRNEANMKEALSYLEPMRYDQIAANKCATLVIRAFATTMDLLPAVSAHARLPPQDDVEREEYRQIAISIVKQHESMVAFRKRWHPFIQQLDPQPEMLSENEMLAALIRVWRIDSVDRYGLVMMRRIRGYGYGSLEGSGYQSANSISAGLLTDVCAGLRGRTTSRLEDETVCLGILLQVSNLEALLDIPPVPWRWKQVLMAKRPSGILSKCHQKRMKSLLSQIMAAERTTDRNNASSLPEINRINALPQSLIFWNVARLEDPGWAWAPMSFTAALPEQNIHAERNGRLTRQGIEIDFPGFILRRVSHVSSPHAFTRGATLIIHLDSSSPSVPGPFRQTWQRLRLRQDDCTRKHKRASSLLSWTATGELVQMAILIKQERIDDAAILVQRYGTRDGVQLTRHIALLERVRENLAGACEVHVEAQWVESGIWRVG
jgi:hypothetical protein